MEASRRIAEGVRSTAAMENSPTAAPKETPVDWIKWFSWRGSPQLVAQVARATQRAASADRCDLVVSVGEDEEIFTSPADFTKDVTPEALRDFKTIRIAAGCVLVTFSRNPTRRMGRDPEEGVVLEVSGAGGDPIHAATALKSVSAAISRGAPTRFAHSPVRKSESVPTPPPPKKTSWEEIILYLTACAIWFTILVLAAVLTDSLSGGALGRAVRQVQTTSSNGTQTLFGDLPSALFPLLLGLAGGLSLRWIRPAIEVAAPGQTRFRRVSRYVAGLLATLALAALSKKVLKL